MAEIITLESSLETSVQQSRLPHWTALQDPRVAADIVERDWPGANELRGIAMGRTETTDISFMGMFRDNVGNTIIILTESTQTYKIIQEKSLWGPSPTFFRIQRPYGSGWGFKAVPFLSNTEERAGAQHIERATGTPGYREQNGIRYSNFYDLFRKIEERQIEYGVVVCVLTGEPTTLIEELAKIVLGAAVLAVKMFGSSFGISPSVVDSLSPILTNIVDRKPVTIRSIAAVSQLISPVGIRPFIDDATAVYEAVDRGDYVTAAQRLGIDNVSIVRDIQTYTSDIVAFSKNSVSSVARTTQAFANLDTINRLRNQLRSGSVLDAIIDEGSITRVPVVQNVLATIQSGAFVGTLPNVSDLVSTALNGTSDTLTDVSLRGLIEMATGQRPRADDLADLTLKALVNKAISEARTGAKIFFMPESIPSHLRDLWADEIARQTGLTVASASLTRRKEWY